MHRRGMVCQVVNDFHVKKFAAAQNSGWQHVTGG